MIERESKNDDESIIRIEDVWGHLGELRAIAYNLLSNRRDALTMQPTELVLSALRRNRPKGQEWDEVTWVNRRYFFKAMHQAMRRALIDHYPRRTAKKRPPLSFVAPEELDFVDLEQVSRERPEHLEALALALEWLESRDEALAEIVQFYYFERNHVDEIAALVEKSPRTVKRRLQEARALLGSQVLRILNE